MIDDQLIMLQFLQGNVGIIAITTVDRIYAARNTPPEGYQPADGAALVFKRRGDRPIGEDGRVISASFQFKCYGGGGNSNQQRLSAEQLYRALYDALEETTINLSYAVMGAQKEGGGEVLIDPETQWPYNLSFFRAQLRKTS